MRRHGFDLERLNMEDFSRSSLYSLMAGNAMSIPVIGTVLHAVTSLH